MSGVGVTVGPGPDLLLPPSIRHQLRHGSSLQQRPACKAAPPLYLCLPKDNQQQPGHCGTQPAEHKLTISEEISQLATWTLMKTLLKA